MGSVFLLNVVLARLGTDDYSAFLTAAAFVPLMATLATMGVPYTLVRVVRADAANVDRRRDAVRGALALTAIGGLACAAAFWLASDFFPADPKWGVVRAYPELVAAWFAISALCMVAANYLQGIDDFRAAALVGARNGGLIPNVLALAVVAGMAVAGSLTLGATLTVQVAAYLTALVLAVAYIRRSLRRGHDAPAAPTPAAQPQFTARWYFAESWPNLLNQLIAVLLVEVDLLWIACLANETTVAQYGAIRNLRLLVTAPMLVTAVALPPFVAELYSRGETAKLERLVRASATVLALPSIAALLVFEFAPALMLRMYGEEFVDSTLALQILSIGAIVHVLSGNNGMVLTMTGRHRDLLAISVAGLALYLAASPPLVQRWGVTGAAAAFTIQTVAANVAMTLRVKQTIGIWVTPLTSWAALRDETRALVRRFAR
jgi:O-antigen/teichoic acid export membrane protein